jgi:predicted patatin/cPLA2 family phospholipase
MSNARDDWANYRRFINHKNALNMIFNYRPPSNQDVQFDIERAADEEGISVTDYLKGPSHE